MSGRNNNRRKKVIPKKKRVNKKKVMLLICFIGVFIFGVSKLTLGVNQVIKDKEKKEVKSQEKEIIKNQFELEDEKEDELDKKHTILVDPGHGGHDKGNQDRSRKIYEKDVALEIGKKVASKLSKQDDIQVIISRTEDKFVSVEDRVKIANSQDVDVLVSIHLNAEGGGNGASGVETYYRKGAIDGSDKLAEKIQDTIGSYISIEDRGAKEGIYKIIKDSRMPAVSVECGFLTNSREAKKLLDPNYQNQLSDGIVQGILSFLDEEVK